MTPTLTSDAPPTSAPAARQARIGADFAADFLRHGGIADLFFARAREMDTRPLLHRWEDDGWRAWSWGETARRVASLARALREQGIRPGDRVLLAAENRVEWHVSALAILTARAIHVPLSLSGSVAEWTEIIRNAEPRGLIASPAGAKKFRAAIAPLAWSGLQVEMVDQPAPGVLAWDALVSGSPLPPEPPAALDDVCCLIYTSGTGGTPKGVVQTHRNILWNCVGAATNLAPYGLGGDRFLSFLPLSHTYEHTAGFVCPLAIRAEIFVSRGPEHFARELRTAAPTVLIVVPRFCEVMEQRVAAGLARQPRWRQRAFARTADLGRRQVRAENLPWSGRLWQATLGRAVARQFRAHFGGKLKCLLSAGAPLRAATSEFFNGLGLPLHEAYGQTEAAPGITMQVAHHIRAGNVGVPMYGVEVRLADDGEVLVRGPNVMAGYWRDPAATAHALPDGWLRTGDIGRFEPDGALVIVDRKKDFLKTAGGDLIPPQPIELALTAQPGVAQAMLCGEGRSHLSALIVPDPATREELARGTRTLSDVHALVQRAVDRVNAGLAAKLRVRHFLVLTEPFTVENGLLTGTLKLRRRRVLETYAERIRALEGDA